MKIEDTDEMNELRRERDNWKESAAQCSRNADFYRGIVCGIGAQFGVEARTSDDGSIQDTVLALKVPELVEAALTKLSAFTSARPDSPECVEALRCAKEGCGDLNGCQHSKVLALNLRALIVREGELWEKLIRAELDAQSLAVKLGEKEGEKNAIYAARTRQQARAERAEAELAALKAGPGENSQELKDALDEAQKVECSAGDCHPIICTLRAAYRSALSRLAEAEKTRDFTSDWYKVRFERMDKWMRENAPAESRDQYFSIQANGQPTPWEKPAYVETIHAMKMAVADVEVREKTALNGIAERVNNEGDDSQACVSDIGYLVRKALAALHPAAPSKEKPE